jgi:hypothetical protein
VDPHPDWDIAKQPDHEISEMSVKSAANPAFAGDLLLIDVSCCSGIDHMYWADDMCCGDKV